MKKRGTSDNRHGRHSQRDFGPIDTNRKQANALDQRGRDRSDGKTSLNACSGLGVIGLRHLR